MSVESFGTIKIFSFETPIREFCEKMTFEGSHFRDT
jgi:hypothetical protein